MITAGQSRHSHKSGCRAEACAIFEGNIAEGACLIAAKSGRTREIVKALHEDASRDAEGLVW